MTAQVETFFHKVVGNVSCDLVFEPNRARDSYAIDCPLNRVVRITLPHGGGGGYFLLMG